MQTSIEYFAESCGVLYTLYGSGEIDLNQFQTAFNKEYQQAKEMHKQEIMDAYAFGQFYKNGYDKNTSEQYYNETFKTT